MKNVVTPETARKLKEAGFNQPELTSFQIWYLGDCPHMAMDIFYSNGGYALHNAVGFNTETKLSIKNRFVYAPTATGIMWELGHEWDLFYYEAIQKFVCKNCDTEHLHSNPAEAAALAWLEKYAK